MLLRMSSIRTARVIHVDVGNPMTGINEGDDHDESVYLCFWAASTPLGHCTVRPEELPLSSTEVKMRAAEAIRSAVAYYISEENVSLSSPLKAIANRSQLHQWNSKFTSRSAVIICTQNRTDSLRRCLDAICLLERSPDE